MTFIIVSCPTHGTIECPDMPSMRAYVPIAREVAEWSCCETAVIDPYGVCDY